MSEAPLTPISIYEKAFAPSNKTDAVLVVNGNKLHVNKALLSCHSDYFDSLFNGDFKEKSMEEITIEDVVFEDFATVLSFVHKRPIAPTDKHVGRLLEIAERFLLPAATNYLEMFIISNGFTKTDKLLLADKYKLNTLLRHALQMYQKRTEIINNLCFFANLSTETKAKVLDRIIYLR